MGVEGKRFRPTVLLLMATTLNVSVPRQLYEVAVENLSIELRTRRQCIAKITEMIHVSGKTGLMLALCKQLRDKYSLVAVTGSSRENSLFAEMQGEVLTSYYSQRYQVNKNSFR
ncbi:hypothetical protein OROMI_031345 [Orobanche minor]